MKFRAHLDADPVARVACDRLSASRKRQHVLAIDRVTTVPQVHRPRNSLRAL